MTMKSGESETLIILVTGHGFDQEKSARRQDTDRAEQRSGFLVRQRWDANRVVHGTRALFRGSSQANALTEFSQDAWFFRGFRVLWSDVGDAIEM
jgi:hypothetical protein